MGQQGSHPSADQKSNRGSNEILGNDASNGTSKNKLFKGFGSKGKSKSAGGKGKKGQQSGAEGDYAASNTPKAAHYKEVKNANILGGALNVSEDNLLRRPQDDMCDMSPINTQQGTSPNYKKIYLNETPVSLQSLQLSSESLTDSSQGMHETPKGSSKSNISRLQPSVLNLNKTPLPSVLDVDRVKVALKDSKEKVSPTGEVFLDARSNHSPVDDYLSAPENGSLLSVCTERPPTALSSRTITPIDDYLNNTPKNTSLELINPPASGEAFCSRGAHKEVLAKPYVLTSRLLSSSGKEDKPRRSDVRSATSGTNATTTHNNQSKLPSQPKHSNPVASKFGFSLESGMEATAHENEEGDVFAPELLWEESDKDTDMEAYESATINKTKGSSTPLTSIASFQIHFLLFYLCYFFSSFSIEVFINSSQHDSILFITSKLPCCSDKDFMHRF